MDYYDWLLDKDPIQKKEARMERRENIILAAVLVIILGFGAAMIMLAISMVK